MGQKQVNIGVRLAASFCLVIALGLAGFFGTVRELRRSLERSRQTLQTINAGISLAKDVSLASRDMSADTLKYVYTQDQSDAEFKWQADEEAEKDFCDLIAVLARLPHSQALVEQVIKAQKQDAAACDPMEEDMLHLARQGRTAQAAQIFSTRYTPARFALEIDMENLEAALDDYRAKSTRHEIWATQQVVQDGWIVQGLIFAVSLVVGVGMSRFTAASMRQVMGAQRAVRRSEARFRALVQNATDVICIVDAQGSTVYVSPSVERVRGLSPDELLGEEAISTIHPDDRARAEAIFEQVMQSPGVNLSAEMRLRHAQWGWIACEGIVCNLLHEPGVEGILITYRDVSERKTFEKQLQHQAFHDALTGLPNRARFLDRLEQSMAHVRRCGGSLAVLFVDLDNFKVVNDSLGHQAGDLLLTTVAERIGACAREGDTLARLGGDEFTLLLDGAETRDAIAVAERITDALQRPLILLGHTVFVTASLGIAVGGGRMDPVTDAAGSLLRDADVAMYQAKHSGKARFALFEPGMSSRAMERMEMESELRRAIEQSELHVHYQPIMSLRTGQVVELEALVRWEHPRLGMIMPDKFIPVAEETGLITELGRWVLREACRQGTEWHQEHPQEPLLSVSVNLSVKELQQHDLVEQIAAALQDTGFPASSLKLEITETVMMLDAEANIEHLSRLRDLGVRLAVDDFGTGYSSMAYLSRLPIDTLKIDRAFVQRLGQQAEDDAIVRAIVTLAKTLDLSITSEGIETSEQLHALQTLGCDRGQGYYYARPLTSTAAHAFLAAARLPHVEKDAALAAA